jgi:transcriptional regulator with PAS, ATPase and Fis domain
LNKASESLGKKKPTPPPELITLLSNHNFPGNVRELESMVFDAVSNHRSGKLSMDLFKRHIFREEQPIVSDSERCLDEVAVPISFSQKLPTLKQAEHFLIAEAMRRAEGNQSIAAMSLGISRQALNKRLKKASH